MSKMFGELGWVEWGHLGGTSGTEGGWLGIAVVHQDLESFGPEVSEVPKLKIWSYSSRYTFFF